MCVAVNEIVRDETVIQNFPWSMFVLLMPAVLFLDCGAVPLQMMSKGFILAEIDKLKQFSEYCLIIEEEPQPEQQEKPAKRSNKEAIWLYAELFLGHHDGSCHGVWWFVVVHVMVCGSSVENSLRYWPKCAFLVKPWGCYPSFLSSLKVNPTSWRFCANPSRIHWDIDRNMQF